MLKYYFNGEISMKTCLRLAVALGIVIGIGGCKSDHEDVTKERIEAQKEISKAQRDVAEEEIEANKEISKARAKGDLEGVEKEKIEGTGEIAKAEKKVEDEKIEATEEISKARKEAGESSGTYQRE